MFAISDYLQDLRSLTARNSGAKEAGAIEGRVSARPDLGREDRLQRGRRGHGGVRPQG